MDSSRPGLSVGSEPQGNRPLGAPAAEARGPCRERLPSGVPGRGGPRRPPTPEEEQPVVLEGRAQRQRALKAGHPPSQQGEHS